MTTHDNTWSNKDQDLVSTEQLDPALRLGDHTARSQAYPQSFAEVHDALKTVGGIKLTKQAFHTPDTKWCFFAKWHHFGTQIHKTK